MLLIFSFMLKYKLNDNATSDLLRLINCVIGSEVLPTSVYMFKKIFHNNDFEPKTHKFCSNCKKYAGSGLDEEGKSKSQVQCPNCSQRIDLNVSDNTFLTFDLEGQIINIIKNNSDVFFGENHKTNGDVTNGKTYRRFMSNNENEAVITLTLNTDGAQPMKSKRKTLWPILGIINELSPLVRFKSYNKIFAALWYNKKQPDMQMFFKPLLDEIKILSEQGLYVDIDHRKVHVKVFVLICSCDSPAKSKLAYQNQHNGYYSCPYCLHKGVSISSSSVIKYPFENQVEKRTDSFIRRQMVKCCEKKEVIESLDFYGYKGLSPLYYLPSFDLSTGLIIDYMHHVSGVIKQFFSLAIKENPERISVADECLKYVKGITEMSRYPRPLSESGSFKAREWINLLIYYGPVIFLKALNDETLKTFWKFSSIIYDLLRADLDLSDLELLSIKMEKFVRNFQKLFGRDNMNSIVHQMLHLVDCVRQYGSLYNYSCFSFEDENGILIKHIRGVKNIPHQIFTRLNNRTFYENVDTFTNINQRVKEYCYALHKNYKEYCIVEGVTTRSNKNKFIKFSADDLKYFQLEELNINTGYRFFNMVYIKKKVFKIKSEKRKLSDDSYIKYSGNKFGRIWHILQVKDAIKIIVEKYDDKCHQDLDFPSHIQVFKVNEVRKFEIIDHFNIIDKCISMRMGIKLYLTSMPNDFENDK